jgi:hypothetical protein
MTLTDLRQAERRAFRTAYDDGLWDVLLACVVAMLAIGPLLSESLGDFWSAAVFLPVWAGAYLVIWLIRRWVVAPRVGVVRFGEYRQRRLRTFTLLMLAGNVVALVGGLVCLALAPSAGLAPVIVFCLTVLVFASAAAYFLDTPRLFLYGLLLAVSFAVGEWLFREGYAAHHGFPIVFGVATIVIASVGVVRFVRLVARTRPATSAIGDEPHGEQ